MAWRGLVPVTRPQRGRIAKVGPDAKIFAANLAGAIAIAGVDPTLGDRALQATLLFAVADRRGECCWDIDHTSWVVTRMYPEGQEVYGRTLEEDLV